MHAIALNHRALDSFHALRVEPFLKLTSIHPPTFDPRTKAFTFTLPAASVISHLMLTGHVQLAVSLRDTLARSVIFSYYGNRFGICISAEMPDGSIGQLDPANVSPGLDLALADRYLPAIADSLAAADRYLAGMTRLVYCAPELLLNTQRNGVSYRVRTDTPPVDSHLIATLDRALSLDAVYIVAFRITRSQHAEPKRELVEPAQVVRRSHPLRPLAALALGRFLNLQPTTGIFMR